MHKAVASLRWLLAGLVLLTVSLPQSALANEEVGRDLAQRVYDRPDGKDMSTRSRMVLQEKGGEPRVRQMYTYRLEEARGQVRSLIRFTAPADIRGTGLLTLDHPDGSSDQWVYLPALDRSRRISAERKGGRFVGSDIFFEDLQDRKVDMDRHRLLREEPLFEMPTQVLESIPVEPGNSTYGKRISWIHKPSLLPLRIDFYAPGRDAQPIKRMEVHRIEQVQGYWTVMDNTITDLASGHRTRTVLEKVVYDRGLPASLFTSRSLEDTARERAHRP